MVAYTGRSKMIVFLPGGRVGSHGGNCCACGLAIIRTWGITFRVTSAVICWLASSCLCLWPLSRGAGWCCCSSVQLRYSEVECDAWRRSGAAAAAGAAATVVVVVECSLYTATATDG